MIWAVTGLLVSLGSGRNHCLEDAPRETLLGLEAPLDVIVADMIGVSNLDAASTSGFG